MKGIFDTSPTSTYDDSVERYHFPSRYLRVAEALVGDWIVYRETRADGGRQAYVAVARVSRIDPDPARADHAYAVMEDYLPFDRPVPFSAVGGRYWEAPLRAVEARRDVGASLRGRSVRALDDADFAAIVHAGLTETLAPENARRLNLGVADVDAPTFEYLHAPLVEQERRIEQMLVNRKIRDANFRRQVCEAYGDTCAVTGLKIINGGGRSEVQAAHIWGVGEGGPDVVQNGLALSGTVHWLFDRHLISLTPDYRLLVAHNRVPSELLGLFAKQMDGIHLPKDRRLWPRADYVARHREAFSAA